MIDAESLSQFVGAYPERPARLHHDLHRHPLAGRHVLEVMIRQLPAGNINALRNDETFFQQIGAQAALAVFTASENICELRLNGLEQAEPYGAWANEIRKFLRPLLTGTSRGLSFSPAELSLQAMASETRRQAFNHHTLLFQLEGQTLFTLSPARRLEVFSPDARPDGLGGVRLRADGDEPVGETLELHEGEALFLPARTPMTALSGERVSVQFMISWQTDELLQEAASAAFRQRIGLPPRPAPSQLLRRVEAMLYRITRR